MSKRFRILALLVLCALLLSSCAGQQERFPVSQGVAKPVQANSSSNTGSGNSFGADYDYDTGDYDPTTEEGGDVEYLNQSPVTVSDTEPVYTIAPVLTSEYAGATPVVIDPIDKPTPTPAPALTITSYQTFDATKIRLSFEGPTGWTADDSKSDSYTITNPDPSMSFPAQLTVSARSVSSEYTETDLKREVKSVINGLKGDYTNFSATQTAGRTLFDKSGIYEDFTGTLKGTEVKVWGRVHAVTVNKTLVTVLILTPNEYSRTYKNTLYNQFRHTVKFTH
ncbi:MAG: hypothetical protein IKH38_00985 [Clostridia bacterium]|nr:hypothetical protein [Clostridia bacterium]